MKISKIKKSPQFGWVKKLQRTAGFQKVRGGYLVFFQNTFENHRDINLDTHRHRQTDRSLTDWPASVGQNYTEAVCPGRFSHTKSVCPFVRPTVRAGSAGESDCPGRFRRRIKTRNCHVTHRQTDALREFIYKIKDPALDFLDEMNQTQP